MQRFDLLVIGSGQGGVPLAVDFAKAGKRAAIFERGALGGSCVNYGCTPSKAFLAAAHRAGRARLGAPLGIHAEVRVDFPAVMERVRRIVGEWRDGVEQKLAAANVTIVHAEARFENASTVIANGESYTAPTIVIDTGTTAAIPPTPGLAQTPYLTNATFFELRELPARTLVIGGGYIGLELGQGIARLGSRVTIVHKTDQILANETAEVAAALTTAFEADGIEIALCSDISRVEHDGRVFRVTLDGGAVHEGETLVVATGRTPNTPALALERAGIACDARGYVAVDAHLRTNVPGVFALGDAAGQPAFTHVSWEDYRRVKAVLAGEGRTRDDRALGYAVYTDPQVGRAGLSLEQALAQGIDAREVTKPLSEVARAIEWGEENGFYTLVVDAKSDRILGATLVGYEAGELVHVFLNLIEAGATWHVLERTVGIHPTYAEAFPVLARELMS